MCIARSVGTSGANDITDVMVFQSLFNLNLARFRSPRPAPLKVDGRIGAKTIRAIEAFEVQVMGLKASDGMVAPGDATVQALLKGLPPGPVKEKLAIVMPRAVPTSINRYYDALVTSMKRYDITTPLRIAHFIAQIGHESASFRYTEELADGSAYEGRRDLGNTEAGDGRRYKGRGLIQLTGRANYAAYSADTGIDYLASPQKVASDPFVATDVSCWFWARNKLNSLADRDDIKAVTKRVNGGYNGLDDRLDYLGRAKAVLAARP
jgi:putative chitinase